MRDHVDTVMQDEASRRSSRRTEEPAAADSHLAAFRQHRPLLLSLAYRMLGSWADAEDIVQETYVRWQQTSEQEIDSPRSFLVTITSRLCINQLQSARVKRETYVGQWLPEPVLTPAGDPTASARLDESLSMAFLVLLERLTPAERAVFLLREVFEYDYDAIAPIVGQSPTACRQILHRARQHVANVRPRFPSSPQQREGLARRFVAASLHGDMQGLLELLADEIVLYADGGGKAAAVPQPVRGPDRVARLLINARRKFVPESAEPHLLPINGELGVVTYLAGRPRSVVTFAMAGDRITAIYLVTNPDKLARLPPLPDAAS